MADNETTEPLGELLFEDSSLRIMKWHFPNHASTQGRNKGSKFSIVPLQDGVFRIELTGETYLKEFRRGVPYNQIESTAHNVVNASGVALDFVEIELK